MLDEKAWLAVSTLIRPKGLLLGRGQDSVWDSQVLKHQTSSSMSLCLHAVMMEQEGATPTLFPQSWEHETVQNV